ncbi:LysE family translocator [Paracoccus sp. IB05]|uniref:LysE family translocator n=1 Tax=Paracoccus sp. IB05 TaxID=2779367 RepID=UPI0018E8A792|nr:LysE family translocator [Paracoccus sp. IB05]MBJ2153970.1 LysE family translocator [Paracoccus sp. IB05]
MGLSAFLAAYVLHLIAAASPGPAVLMTARTAVTEGMRTSFFLACGIGFGAVFWALAALFGLAVLFRLAPALFWGFRILGALFLLWIAFNMWRHAPEPLGDNSDHPPRGALAALWLGLATQFANPKAAVFFGAIFVGTVPPGTTWPWLTALLIAVFLNEVLFNLLIARLFSLERTRRAYARLKTVIDRCFGGILALLSFKIAAT